MYFFDFLLGCVAFFCSPLSVVAVRGLFGALSAIYSVSVQCNCCVLFSCNADSSVAKHRSKIAVHVVRDHSFRLQVGFSMVAPAVGQSLCGLL